MNIKRIIDASIPTYVVMESSSDCGCRDDETCDCVPSLYLTVGGLSGYGSAHWTYSDETCPVSIDHFGKAYWCNFLAQNPFWSSGVDDAAQRLREILDRTGQYAKVNGVYNKCAEQLIKTLENNQ